MTTSPQGLAPEPDFERDLRRAQMRVDHTLSQARVLAFEEGATSIAFKRALCLTAPERSRLIGALADSLGSASPSLGVERTPGVCGGSACLVRTRIPVWSLIAYIQQGATDATLLENFPTLRPADLHSARLYAETHADEIEREIRENESGD